MKMLDKLAKQLLKIALTIISILLHGFTISKLWNWFITSTFGVTTITLIQGLALGLTIHFLSGKNSITWKDLLETQKQIKLDSQREKSFWESNSETIMSILISLIALLVGRIYLALM